MFRTIPNIFTSSFTHRMNAKNNNWFKNLSEDNFGGWWNKDARYVFGAKCRFSETVLCNRNVKCKRENPCVGASINQVIFNTVATGLILRYQSGRPVRLLSTRHASFKECTSSGSQ